MKKILITIFMLFTGHTSLLTPTPTVTVGAGQGRQGPVPAPAAPPDINTTYNNARNAAFNCLGQAATTAITAPVQNDIKQAILYNASTSLLQNLLDTNDRAQKTALLNNIAHATTIQASGQAGFEILIKNDNFNDQQISTINAHPPIANLIIDMAISTLYHATQADIQTTLDQQKFDTRAKLSLLATVAAFGADMYQAGGLQGSYANKLYQGTTTNHLLIATSLASIGWIVGFDKIQNHVLQPAFNKLKQVYNWMRQHPKESLIGLTLALGLNRAIRGDKSLISHCQQHGIQGIGSATVDQITATGKALTDKCATSNNSQQQEQQNQEDEQQYFKNNKNIQDAIWYAGTGVAGAATTYAGYKTYNGCKAVCRSAKNLYRWWSVPQQANTRTLTTYGQPKNYSLKNSKPPRSYQQRTISDNATQNIKADPTKNVAVHTKSTYLCFKQRFQSAYRLARQWWNGPEKQPAPSILLLTP